MLRRSGAWLSTPLSDSRRMRGQPMPGDLGAAADPEIGAARDMVEETLQRRGPAGAPGQAAMQPDRHHLGLGGALAAEEIQAVPEMLGEAVIRGEAGGH